MKQLCVIPILILFEQDRTIFFMTYYTYFNYDQTHFFIYDSTQYSILKLLILILRTQHQQQAQQQMGKKKALESQAQKTKIIIKGNSSTYYKGTVSVDYRPNRKHQLYKTHKTKAFYPIFNKDKKCYTPTFILRKEDVENDQELQKTHQKKIKQYVTEISEDQILFAKPRSKHKYCGVCKDHYQDYKQHIQSQDHKTCNKNAKFSKQISKLINNFMVNKLFIEENDYYQKLKCEESYWGATSNQTADKLYLNDKKVVVVLSDE